MSSQAELAISGVQGHLESSGSIPGALADALI